jgi:hypothetical protein
MKYTEYLIYEQFIDINSLETKNLFLRLLICVILIPIVIMGISLILCLLPMAATVDVYNYIKSNVIYIIKYGYYKYIKNIILLSQKLIITPHHIPTNNTYLLNNIRKVIRSPGSYG